MKIIMDFSSLNPRTTNALNLAARDNDTDAVERLLKKINPSCVDNRGWTCLHEAAAKDSYESLLLILAHKDCRPLAETHEGHTALYIACRWQSSVRTIKALLESAPDIANYGSTEGVTPLHLASAQSRLDVIQLLLDHGAMINVQDFDRDTPLHDAALKMQFEAMELLLHAGAYPDIKNSSGLTAFHLACAGGCLKTVKTIAPFVSDINVLSEDYETPLTLGTMSSSVEVVKYLLQLGADPHIMNKKYKLPIDIALGEADQNSFKELLAVTDKDQLSHNMVIDACKPHFFTINILEQLLVSDLGIEFFPELKHAEMIEFKLCPEYAPLYATVTPLGSLLEVCYYIHLVSAEKLEELFYLYLMQGVSVNATELYQCPPLVYFHYQNHCKCFGEVFKILLDHGCNVDYCSINNNMDLDKCIPDAFIASLNADPYTLPSMIPYSLWCEPGHILKFSCSDWQIIRRIPLEIQSQLLSMIDTNLESITTEAFPYYAPCLKHLCRLSIRRVLKSRGIRNTINFLSAIKTLPLPTKIMDYLRYA